LNQRIVRKIAIIFVIIVILLTFFSNTIRNFSLPRVQADTVSAGALLKEISGQGTIQAKDSFQYYVPSNMKVLDLYVQAGDKVAKGQKIAQLDVTELEESLKDETSRLNEQKAGIDKLKDTRASVLNANRDIKQAKDKVDDCQKALDNIKQLHSIGQATEDQLNNALRSLDNAKAEYALAVENKAKMLRDNSRDVQSSQETLSTQQRKVEDLRKQIKESATVTAAGDGTIMELNFDKGTIANDSKPLYILSDSSAGFELKVMVDGDNAGYLSVGQDVEVTLTGLNNKTVKGKLSKITDYVPQSSEQQGTTAQERKELSISLNDSSLKGNEAAEIDITKKTKSYNILVPNEAVYSDNNGKFVYVTKEVKGPLGKETSVQRVDIHDEDSDFSKTAVTTSLNLGDKVITQTTKPLTDGGSVILSGQ
jgi:HlyD family secretion protein